MGLVYNHKNKLDLVVLSEEELEKNEGEAFSFELLPDDKDLCEARSSEEEPERKSKGQHGACSPQP